jgi:chromosome partitioning protein
LRKIAVVNQKGGAGKTTTAVNLAAALGELGESVLLIDLDPQASASSWCGASIGQNGLLEVFTRNERIEGIVSNTGIRGVELVASSTWLVGVEKAVANEVGAEFILGRALEDLRPRDYVLIDCPPSLGFLAVSALAAVDEVVVPVAAHVMELAGLAALMQTLDAVQERLNQSLEISGVLACRVDTRTNLAREVVGSLRERFGELVFNAVIRESIRLAEAPSFAQPITMYAPNSSGAEDYRRVAGELVKQREAVAR